MRYHEFTIFSDMDGTLLPYYQQDTPAENLRALTEFTAAGGRFAIATGRPEVFIADYVAKLPVNFPCILLNGSAVYDFQAKRYLHTTYLPATVQGYLRRIERDMPWVGIVLSHDSPEFDYRLELQMIDDVRLGNPPIGSKKWREAVDVPWFKALFLSYAERCDEMEAYLRGQNFPDVDIVRSSKILVEMLPKYSSKGSALEALYKMGVLQREKTVAIGDYNNDLEMLRAAGIAACVESAPPELKLTSQYVTCSCEQGALADLIACLKRDYPG